MRRVTGAVALVGLVGCGPIFDGRWSGLLDETSTCRDGSGGADTRDVSWTIESTATNELSILAVGGIPFCLVRFQADQEGNRARLRAKNCPSTTSDDGTMRFTEVVKSGGTLVVNGDRMQISMETGTDIQYLRTGMSGGCSNTVAGVLNLEK